MKLIGMFGLCTHYLNQDLNSCDYFFPTYISSHTVAMLNSGHFTGSNHKSLGCCFFFCLRFWGLGGFVCFVLFLITDSAFFCNDPLSDLTNYEHSVLCHKVMDAAGQFTSPGNIQAEDSKEGQLSPTLLQDLCLIFTTLPEIADFYFKIVYG